MTDETRRWMPFDVNGEIGWYRRDGSIVRYIYLGDGRGPNEMSAEEVAALFNHEPGDPGTYHVDR